MQSTPSPRTKNQTSRAEAEEMGHLVQAWQKLPRALRAGILALITAGGRDVDT